MDCVHKVPHEHMDNYCDGADDPMLDKCPKCAPELISDVTFFREDFEL